MKPIILAATGIALSFSTASFADGDAAAGEKLYKKCKACHVIKNGDEVIQKGGKTGPNLYGIVGRAIGSEDFKYSASMIAAGEAGLIWSEESIAMFVADPKAYLKEVTGDAAAKSKMSFKLKSGGEDLAAYLASLAPMDDDSMDGDSMEESDDSDESSDKSDDSDKSSDKSDDY